MLRNQERVVVSETTPTIVSFEPSLAPTIASWVKSDEELFLLAPKTLPPLTAAKVISWRKTFGRRYVWAGANHQPLLAYAELNPLGANVRSYWLGHCVMNPAIRGRGLGPGFVRAVVRRGVQDLLADRILLIVFPRNTAAVRCYQRAGFAIAGEEVHDFQGVQETLIRMELPCDQGVLGASG